MGVRKANVPKNVWEAIELLIISNYRDYLSSNFKALRCFLGKKSKVAKFGASQLKLPYEDITIFSPDPNFNPGCYICTKHTFNGVNR
ncbi:hypothetical protein GCM10009122_11910 [Fulvivirga kasyanovii]